MALVDRLPYETDLVVAAGATFRFAVRWSPGGEPADFTGWNAWMPLGRDLDDPIRELTAEDGEIEFMPDGVIQITMSPERTAELAVLDGIPTKGRGATRTGTLYYNLTVQDALGTVHRMLRGKLFVEHDVQRPK